MVALVHGPDRRNFDDTTRRTFFRRVANAIRRIESGRKHQRSLIAGDFNAHPFDPAVVDADGLHAIGILMPSGRAERTVGGERLEFFYNPTWRLYGQNPHPVAGAATYYRLRTGVRELG